MSEDKPGFVTDWRAAEENAARWMRGAGYGDAKTTATGPDAGIDVTSRGAVAQVKFEAHQVGRPHLQRFVGATVQSDRERLFFTGTGYTPAARQYADEAGVALFAYAMDGTVTPVNDRARQLEQAGGKDEGDRDGGGDGNGGLGCALFALVPALFFTWGFVGGLFNPSNYPLTGDALAGGLVILVLAVLCWLATIWAVRTMYRVRKSRPVSGRVIPQEHPDGPQED